MPANPYPKDFPIEDVQTILRSFRDSTVSPNRVINAAWAVSGYTLGQFFPVTDGSDDWPPRVGDIQPFASTISLDWKKLLIAVLRALTEQLLLEDNKK